MDVWGLLGNVEKDPHGTFLTVSPIDNDSSIKAVSKGEVPLVVQQLPKCPDGN